jgi:hypothetical protein
VYIVWKVWILSPTHSFMHASGNLELNLLLHQVFRFISGFSPRENGNLEISTKQKNGFVTLQSTWRHPASCKFSATLSSQTFVFHLECFEGIKPTQIKSLNEWFLTPYTHSYMGNIIEELLKRGFWECFNFYF